MSKNILIKGIVILIVMVSLVGARVFYLQRSHYLKAEEHYAKGELKLAVREYGTAVGLYVPLSPYGERSAQRLWRIGTEFEGEGELLMAQSAFSALRSSLYGSRSLYTPGREWIAQCEEKLAALRASMLVEEGRISPEEFEAARIKHLDAMRTDRAPAPVWSALAALSFFGFVASVFYVIFRGFTPEARLRKKEALKGLVAAVVSFALWVLSLMMA